MVHAYNSSKHATTGYTPFYLMFGRHPWLPIDVTLAVNPEDPEQVTTAVYVKNLLRQLEFAYERVYRNMAKAASTNKKYYDKQARDTCLEPGDRVIVKNLRIWGEQNLKDQWERDCNWVIRRIHRLPVYKVKSETEGKHRTLYHNLLLPFNSIPPVTAMKPTGGEGHLPKTLPTNQ